MNMVSIGFSQQSSVINALSPLYKKPLISLNSVSISCRIQSDDSEDSSRKNKNRLTELAIVALAAGILALGSVEPVFAASGGRVGGQSFKKSAPRPSRPSRPSGPRINNSRTNIYINPPIAPPLVGGYGYGYGVPSYGGWGWSPFSFFAPGPGLVVGGGFDTLVLFMFLGAAAAVVRRFFGGSRGEEDD